MEALVTEQDDAPAHQIARFRKPRNREALSKLLKDNMGERWPKLREYVLFHCLDVDNVEDIMNSFLFLMHDESVPPAVRLAAIKVWFDIHDGPVTQKVEHAAESTITIIRGPKQLAAGD